MTPDQFPKRGAIPSPRSVLAAATPHVALVGAPPNFVVIPKQISFWGNYDNGDCVTAEEAFAKACNDPEIFISEDEVITWATKHGVLNGAGLPQVMTWMQNDGFPDGLLTQDDGPYYSVDWTNAGTLQSAISQGPVKIGVAGDQLDNTWHAAGGSAAGGVSGWFATGYTDDADEDHCVTLCGYGSMSWLAQQLRVQVPAGIDGTQPGYALFTWDSIGIIDVPSVMAITQEAWLRQPTTVTRGVASDIGVASWTANRVDTFVVGTNGNLYHKAWNGTAWLPSVSGYGDLGGQCASPPAVASWGPDRLDIFVVGTNGNLYHKAWNGTGWLPSVSGYGDLGGQCASPPAVASWGPDRLDIFVVGTNGNLYHKAWNGTAWLPSVSGYGDLGGQCASPPAVASWGPDRLDIFVVGTNGNLYHKAWNGTAWLPSVSGYGDLGGQCASPPAVASWGPDRLDIFVVGTNGNLYHKAWNGTAWLPSVSGYEDLGGQCASPPAVASRGPDRLDIFVVGTNGNLYHKAWNGTAWLPSVSGYEDLGGQCASPPAVATWGPDRLDIFVVGTNGNLYHKAWNGTAWLPSVSGYEDLGGQVVTGFELP